MSVASQDKTTVALGAISAMSAGRPGVTLKRTLSACSFAHTWILTARLLRRWGRDPATVLESLIMPVVLLMTVNIVLGDGISQLTGHSALYGSVPLIAMVGAMSGSMVGGIGLIGERQTGAVPIVGAARAPGIGPAFETGGRCGPDRGNYCGHHVRRARARFPLPAGDPGSVAWLFIPTAFGVAFTMAVDHPRLVHGEHDRGEATEMVWGMLMFFRSGFVPVDQYPRWLQPVVQNQPISYAIEAMRGLSLGGPVLAPMVATLLWSAGIAAACAIPMAIGYRRASMRG